MATNTNNNGDLRIPYSRYERFPWDAAHFHVSINEFIPDGYPYSSDEFLHSGFYKCTNTSIGSWWTQSGPALVMDSSLPDYDTEDKRVQACCLHNFNVSNSEQFNAGWSVGGSTIAYKYHIWKQESMSLKYNCGSYHTNYNSVEDCVGVWNGNSNTHLYHYEEAMDCLWWDDYVGYETQDFIPYMTGPPFNDWINVGEPYAYVAAGSLGAGMGGSQMGSTIGAGSGATDSYAPTYF